MYLGRSASGLGLVGALYSISDGAEGVKQTLYLMRSIANKYKTDLELRNAAAQIVGGNFQKDFAGEVTSLHEFVRDRIRYLKDIDDVETVQTPDKTMQLGYGDCDDKATLLATLLKSIGHPARFVAIGVGKPGEYSHVFVDTFIKDRWIPLETTEPVPAGWAPPRITSAMIVKV
jgi:transglutaminase-like putative cysteine protease